MDKDREELEKLLRESPSLAAEITRPGFDANGLPVVLLPRNYESVRRVLSKTPGLEQVVFPAECPYQLEEIRNWKNVLES